MRFTAWAQRHARSILFLVAILAAAGALSSVSLPVALFPQVSFPRVRISLDAGDRPAEQMAAEVTRPVEEAVRAVPGVRGVRSTTSRGSAEISVNFDWGADMVAAMLEVESEVNKQLPSLPAGTAFGVERMDPTVFPVIAYSLTSSTHSLAELRDLALYTLSPALSSTPGVARTDVQGGETEEYRVEVDPGKLQALGLTVKDVADALSAANVLTAVGKLEQFNKLYLVISDTRFQRFDDIGKTVLKSKADGLVLLDDVAKIERSTEPKWIRVTADGRDAVLFQVYQQPGGNTVQIAADIKEKLLEMGKQIPSGVKLSNWYDQSELIIGSAQSTRDAVLIGICLAGVILIAFLRSWKVTLIAALTVPAVLCSTMLMLSVLGMSFNIMTLGGMAAAVGLIVDDAIVMVEHVIRRLRSGQGHGTRETVMRAAGEFTRPLAGSSAATIIIFAPLAFLSGVAGAFFKTMSLTMAASLAMSFLVAWLAVPILSARWLNEANEIESHGRITRWMHGTYSRGMGGLLKRPALVLLPIAVVGLAGWLAFHNVASGFMPAMDEGGFILDYVSPPGTSLEETDRLLRKVETILRDTPEVQTYSRRTGAQLGGGVTEPNTGDFFVRLRASRQRGIEAVMDGVRKEVAGKVPGLDIQTAQLMEDLIGDLTSVPQPIEVKLYSDDDAVLQNIAPKVADAIGKVRGVVEVVNGIVPAGDALTIHVNRVKAALEGVDPDGLTKAIQDMLEGNVTTQIRTGPKLVGVRVWIPPGARQTMRDIENLEMRAPRDGHLFPLRRVAKLIPVTGQPEITRDDLRRMVAVTARITGRDLGSAAAEVKKVLDTPGLLPPGVPYSLGGLYEQQQIAFKGLTMVMLAAIVLVFLLLLFLYESFRAAGAMLLVAILAVAGVYVGLWVTGTEFNITSRMGMTMVVGIVTEISIFYYSEYEELAGTENRLIMAGIHRMRPILMTSFAAMLALLPLALGLGKGADMLRPLAIAIIAGLVCALPLVLVVLPALLAVLRVSEPATHSPIEIK
jgi:CzcA family heavy metal efflux pump